ncbi:MAG: glycerophosphodiester phosphodiesterase family protein [Saprospiraceae bacterium]|nr:glycerophosphodiester phosphodiesterase family protein [Saprospiraceae bacterium]
MLNKISILLLILFSISACTPPSNKTILNEKMVAPTLLRSDFDWQGHRGCRGLLPENSIPAFLKALELGVTTLELDLAVSRDSQLIVSHEPWLNHDICSKADGSAIAKEEVEKELIWLKTAAEVQKCDCGSRGNPLFKEQKAMRTVKPTLRQVVEAVRKQADFFRKPMPLFNIEIKSQPDFDEKLTPSVSTFAKLVFEEIHALKIADKTCIQSFDPRALEAIHQLDPKQTTAFLVENEKGLAANLKRLSFSPTIYSPFYQLITKKTVDSCHTNRLKIIPWTVNDTADMRQLINMDVDGIITDYPNRILRNL